jgi:hypothetical protein
MPDLNKEKSLLKDLLSSGYSSEDILNLVTSVTYASESANNDLYVLSKYLKDEDIKNLIFNMSGRKIQLPTIDDYYRATLISICFYLLEIMGMKWDEVKERMKQENSFIFDKYISSIDVGRKISKIKKYVNEKMFEILNKDNKEI